MLIKYFEKWYSSYYQLLEYFIKINRFIGKINQLWQHCILDKDLINKLNLIKMSIVKMIGLLEPYLQGLI